MRKWHDKHWHLVINDKSYFFPIWFQHYLFFMLIECFAPHEKEEMPKRKYLNYNLCVILSAHVSLVKNSLSDTSNGRHLSTKNSRQNKINPLRWDTGHGRSIWKSSRSPWPRAGRPNPWKLLFVVFSPCHALFFFPEQLQKLLLC